MILLGIYKHTSTAKDPSKTHSGSAFEDAAYDLFPDESCILQPNERKVISTGLSIIIPSGYWAKFHERSGLSAKNGVHVMAGVVDCPYTGEWKIVLYNSGHDPVSISPDKAIAQFTIEKVRPIEFVQLSSAEFAIATEHRDRKASGFGSSDIVK